MRHDPFVYILRHELPTDECGEFYVDDDMENYDPAALELFVEMEERLRSLLHAGAELLSGPYRQDDETIIHDLLIAVADAAAIEAIVELDQVTVRPANGEIFETSDARYYVGHRRLMQLKGEMLSDFYDGDHGQPIANLDADVRRRLRKVCRSECRSKGYNGPTIREITPLYVEAVYNRQPREWTWWWLNENLEQITAKYEANLRRGNAWFVYEQMNDESVPIFPPVENGKLVVEVIEALVDDEKEGTRQWLVNASPLYGAAQLRMPELQSVRKLEEGELFSSRRGLLWLHQSTGIWLGEIANDLLHQHHGDVVIDVQDAVRKHVVEDILTRLRRRSPEVYVMDCVVDVVHDALDEKDPLQLWYHDLQGLVDHVLAAVRSTGG